MQKLYINCLITLITIKLALTLNTTNVPIRDYNKISAGVYATDNVTFMYDCLSGNHVTTYAGTCADHIALRITAVAMAILQVNVTF